MPFTVGKFYRLVGWNNRVFPVFLNAQGQLRELRGKAFLTEGGRIKHMSITDTDTIVQFVGGNSFGYTFTTEYRYD